MVSNTLQILNIRDWTDKSTFKNSLINLMATPFVYEERDKIDDVIIQYYPKFQSETFPIIDSNNVELFRQLVFIEGIDFLYRAINFSQAIQHLLLEGFYSPAQSMSYQATFYCVRSILGLSGIYCSDIKNKKFIFDAYHTQTQTLNEYIIRNAQKNHQIFWYLLQNILQITIIDNSIIDAGIYNIIRNIDYANCSKLRHTIHYKNNYNFADMFNKKEYTPTPIDIITADSINSNCDYFDILCLYLIFASNLFLSIANYAQGLDDMISKYKKLIKPETNPLLINRQIYEKLKLAN